MLLGQPTTLTVVKSANKLYLCCTEEKTKHFNNKAIKLINM